MDVSALSNGSCKIYSQKRHCSVREERKERIWSEVLERVESCRPGSAKSNFRPKIASVESPLPRSQYEVGDSFKRESKPKRVVDAAVSAPRRAYSLYTQVLRIRLYSQSLDSPALPPLARSLHLRLASRSTSSLDL